jgi:hypothetical protein
MIARFMYTAIPRRSPVLEQLSTAIATTFDAHQLANLPGARSMWAIQAATPAVYLPRFDLGASATGLGGPISAYGTAGFNRPMVEGISVSGINPTGFTLDYGAFDEVSVARPRTAPSGLGQACTCSSSASREEISIAARSTLTTWQSFNIAAEQIRRGAQGCPALSPREANRLSSYRDVNADIGGYIKPDTL